MSPQFKVFPSTEAVLLEARCGRVRRLHLGDRQSQCRPLCARMAQRRRGSARRGGAIRKLFDGKQLVPGVKALLAHIHRDAAWARVKPPLAAFAASDQAAVAAAYDDLRALPRSTQGRRHRCSGIVSDRRPAWPPTKRAAADRYRRKSPGRGVCVIAPWTG